MRWREFGALQWSWETKLQEEVKARDVRNCLQHAKQFSSEDTMLTLSMSLKSNSFCPKNFFFSLKAIGLPNHQEHSQDGWTDPGSWEMRSWGDLGHKSLTVLFCGLESHSSVCAVKVLWFCRSDSPAWVWLRVRKALLSSCSVRWKQTQQEGGALEEATGLLGTTSADQFQRTCLLNKPWGPILSHLCHP
jgi:hypothetical protein